MCDEIDLWDTFPILARSEKAKESLIESFGKEKGLSAFKQLGKKSRSEEWNTLLGGHFYDLVSNESKVVGEDSREGSFGEYPIYINEYEGVFWVSAPEFDDNGYFLWKEDAQKFIDFNWF